jgi:hypothetical protein
MGLVIAIFFCKGNKSKQMLKLLVVGAVYYSRICAFHGGTWNLTPIEKRGMNVADFLFRWLVG